MSRYDLTDIKAAAYGRWPEIHASLGIPAKLLNRKHQPCPYCGGRDRFRYTDYQSSGGYICNQCTPQGGSGFDLLMLVFGYDFTQAVHEVAALLGLSDGQTGQQRQRAPLSSMSAQQPPKDRFTKLAYTWESSQPLNGSDPASLYLQGRGLSLTAPYPEALRFHYALPYWAELESGWQEIGRYPAMIAAVTETGGTLAGLHITYLKPCHSKPQGDSGSHGQGYSKLNLHHPETGELLPAKKMKARYEGIGWLSGRAVKLFEPQHHALMVSEGIESALAARELTGWPTAACLSANSLSAFQWPSELQALGIYADHDETGLKAADRLARRAKLAGLDVFVWKSSAPDTDALDELNAVKAAAAADSIND